MTAAQFIKVATFTLIYVREPAHSAGGVDVTVTGSGGTSAIVAKDRFFYLGR